MLSRPRIDLLAVPLALALAACTSVDVPVKDLGATVSRVKTPVVGGDAVGRGELRVSGGATALSVMGGVVAVGTPVGLLKGSVSKLELTLVNVTAGPGEPRSTGRVKLLARRNGGLFVWSEAGLFHDDQGRLLLSPLSSALAGADLQSLDVFGAGAFEEMWMVDRGTLQHVGGGALSRIAIAGVDAVDLAVGFAEGRALVAAGGTVYLVDISRPEALRVISELGAVSGFARDEAGALYLATHSGLLIRSNAGDFSLRTLDSAAGSSVDAVAAGFGKVLFTSDSRALFLSGGMAIAFAETTSKALAIDSNGDAWLAEGERLIRLETGDPVSFATDVRPFFAAHCNSCHSTGVSGAPVIPWDDYDTARRYGPAALRRLEADGVPPMPPSTVEVLAPSDFAAVARWVQGGMQP